MKNFIQKMTRIVGLAIALVLLVNTFYVPEVSAAQNAILTIYPVLTTSDNRVAVTLCVTYQESTGIFTGASVQRVGFTSDVSNLLVESPVLSADKKTLSVKVSYEYTSWFKTQRVEEYLIKNAP